MVELALELAWGIDEIFSTDADLFDAAGKLNVRLERLTRQWITVRGGEPRLVQYATSPWPRDARLLEHAPAIMGNPFVPPSRIEVGLAGRPAGELRPLPEEWRRSAFETRNSTFAGLRRLSDEGQTPNPIDTCEKLGELWEGAMEAIHSLGHLNTDNTVDSHIRSQSTLGHRQSAIVDALWRRLSLYRDLAEREAAEVEGLLEAKIAGRMGEDFLARLGALPPGASLQAGEDGETAAFLMELVLLFNRVSIGAAPAGWREASDAVDEELFRTLVARFGPNREFDALRPGAVASLMKAQRQRRRAELTARLAKADQLERRRRIRSRRTGCKGRGRRPRVTTIKQLKRAEQRYADVRELLRLDHDDRAAKALEMEGDPPAEPGIEEKINGLEWSVRFFAALGAGLLKREG